MRSKVVDDLEGIIMVLLFIPVFATLDSALFSVLESASGLPFAVLFLAIIGLIEVLGYVKFFREMLGI